MRGTLRNVSTVAFLAGGRCTLIPGHKSPSAAQSLKKTHTQVKKTVKPLNIFVIYIFKNEEDHYVCVLTTYLILFCGGCRRLCSSYVFPENP